MGPVGPRGPAGQDGLDGLDGEESYVFEHTDINFTPENNYEVLLDFPNGFQMLESDVVLVYFWWDQTDDGLDVWTPLPLTLFEPGGTLQYGFDYTLNDVKVFVTSNYILDYPNDNLFADWIARVVVVPAQLQNRTSVDYSDYYSVAEHFGLDTKPIGKVDNLIKRPELNK